MAAEALSQAEIDALLSGFGDSESESSQGAGISTDEQEVLLQYQRSMAKAMGGVLSSLLSVSAQATPDGIAESSPTDAPQSATLPGVAATITYETGLAGTTYLLFSQSEAFAIVSALMGGADVTEFSELESSAFTEVGSQVMGSAHTELSTTLGLQIRARPVEANGIADSDALSQLLQPLGSRFVLLTYQLQGGEIKGTVTQVVPNDLIGALLSAKAAHSSQTTARAPAGPPAGGQPQAPGVAAGVAPVQFSELEPSPQPAPRSLDLILDISLTMKVELGRTRKQVRDVLNLSQGSVVELSKLVGEPLDIIVNDQLFARGEVVVVDENFGVRVTEILSPQERIEALKASKED